MKIPLSSTDTRSILANPQHFADKFKKAQESLGHRTGPNVLWLRETQDDSKFVLPDENFANGFPTISRCLTDFESGIACIVGQANHGKSSLMVSMMTAGLDLNSDLIVVDVSLDDPPKKRYTQYLANLTGLHYSQLNVPTTLNPNQLGAIKSADQKIHDWIMGGRLIPLEASEKITEETLNQIRKITVRSYKTLLNLMRDVRATYPDKKIAFFVDAWNNLDSSNTNDADNLSSINKMLDTIQEVADQERIMCIVSAHVRKTQSRKISLEDIKGTKNMEYSCVWGAIVKNEYRDNSLTDPLLWEDSNGKSYPIVTVETGKTKVSSEDRTCFYVLKAGQCQVQGVTNLEYELLLSQCQGNRT